MDFFFERLKSAVFRRSVRQNICIHGAKIYYFSAPLKDLFPAHTHFEGLLHVQFSSSLTFGVKSHCWCSVTCGARFFFAFFYHKWRKIRAMYLFSTYQRRDFRRDFKSLKTFLILFLNYSHFSLYTIFLKCWNLPKSKNGIYVTWYCEGWIKR